MPKIPPAARIGIFSLLVLVVGAVLAFAGSVGARGNPAAPPSLSAGRTVVAYPPGVPAIQPRASLQGQAGPTFTTDDVVHYIQAQGSLRTTSGAVPAIIQIEFITAQQASALLDGEYIGRPDSALVCYVTLQGPFYVAGPLPPGATNAPSNTASEVFDAQTGNLLIMSYGG